MTPGELKFALCVEAALNRIPEPEYRQLVVEMLMVLSLVVEYHPEQTLGETIDVDELVWEGHNLYLNDQVSDMITLVMVGSAQCSSLKTGVRSCAYSDEKTWRPRWKIPLERP